MAYTRGRDGADTDHNPVGTITDAEWNRLSARYDRASHETPAQYAERAER